MDGRPTIAIATGVGTVLIENSTLEILTKMAHLQERFPHFQAHPYRDEMMLVANNLLHLIAQDEDLEENEKVELSNEIARIVMEHQ